jgi:hypothetical protein
MFWGELILVLDPHSDVPKELEMLFYSQLIGWKEGKCFRILSSLGVVVKC